MVVVFLRDLIFQTKIVSTAQSLGIRTSCVSSVEALRSNLDGERAKADAENALLLIVDLSAGPDALEAIKEVRGQSAGQCWPCKIIAFASHVEAALMNEARMAGADEVMARSKFSSSLPVILQAHHTAV